jgi:phosphoinositide-3-kinase regulatory subunit 4
LYLRRQSFIFLDNEAAILFISFICAFIRYLQYSATKIHVLDLLFVLGSRTSDVVKTERILPFLTALMSDEDPRVRIHSLRVILYLVILAKDLTIFEFNFLLRLQMQLVKVVTIQNFNTFQDYLIPILSPLAQDEDIWIRASYGKYIAEIGFQSLRFIEMSQTLEEFEEIQSNKVTLTVSPYENEETSLFIENV